MARSNNERPSSSDMDDEMNIDEPQIEDAGIVGDNHDDESLVEITGEAVRNEGEIVHIGGEVRFVRHGESTNGPGQNIAQLPTMVRRHPLSDHMRARARITNSWTFPVEETDDEESTHEADLAGQEFAPVEFQGLPERDYADGDHSRPSFNRFLRLDLVRSFKRTGLDDMCAICQDPIRDGACLPCQHAFCADCLFKWVGDAGSNTCPHCRVRLYATHVYPRQAMSLRQFQFQRRMYSYVHTDPSNGYDISRSEFYTRLKDTPAFRDLPMHDALYIVRRAYEHITGPLMPLNEHEQVIISYRAILPHLHAIALQLTYVWPSWGQQMPSRLALQWSAIVQAIETLLQNEWHDQEGTTWNLLWNEFFNAVYERILDARLDFFKTDGDTNEVRQWFLQDKARDIDILQPDEYGQPSVELLWWMTQRLGHHMALMSTRMEGPEVGPYDLKVVRL